MFDEPNNSCYVFKSCRDNSYLLSQSRVCMVVINDSTHSAIMRSFCANKTPTIVYEDNAACVAQLKGGYIKGDRTKHISPKFFFTHDLQ